MSILRSAPKHTSLKYRCSCPCSFKMRHQIRHIYLNSTRFERITNIYTPQFQGSENKPMKAQHCGACICKNTFWNEVALSSFLKSRWSDFYSNSCHLYIHMASWGSKQKGRASLLISCCHLLVEGSMNKVGLHFPPTWLKVWKEMLGDISYNHMFYFKYNCMYLLLQRSTTSNAPSTQLIHTRTHNYFWWLYLYKWGCG